jgi:hypothetical protein
MHRFFDLVGIVVGECFYTLEVWVLVSTEGKASYLTINWYLDDYLTCRHGGLISSLVRGCEATYTHSKNILYLMWSMRGLTH